MTECARYVLQTILVFDSKLNADTHRIHGFKNLRFSFKYSVNRSPRTLSLAFLRLILFASASSISEFGIVIWVCLDQFEDIPLEDEALMCTHGDDFLLSHSNLGSN